MQTSSCFRHGVRLFIIITSLLCSAALVTMSILAAVYSLAPIDAAEPASARNAAHEHSFVGEDYPVYYPPDIRSVLLVPEDTVHYGIAGPRADEEWESIFPPGQGFVCLGPDKRKFGLALYHEMHCLDRIRRGLGKNNYNPHIHHCINYLRQAILCEADTTIEPAVLRSGRKAIETRVERMCKDWTQVYQEGTNSACGK